jgi:hypothetical protein
MDSPPAEIRQPSDRWLRIGVIVIGVAGVLYGAKLLFARPNLNQPVHVIIWALASDVVTDGLIIPLTLLVGWVLTRTIRPRARRYVQGALIVMGLMLPVALIEIVAKNRSYVPLIRSANKQDPSKALLTQNYAGNLVVVLGIIAAVALAAYLLRLVLDHRTSAGSSVHETKPQ